jgi:hypothetical protein
MQAQAAASSGYAGLRRTMLLLFEEGQSREGGTSRIPRKGGSSSAHGIRPSGQRFDGPSWKPPLSRRTKKRRRARSSSGRAKFHLGLELAQGRDEARPYRALGRTRCRHSVDQLGFHDTFFYHEKGICRRSSQSFPAHISLD